MELLLSNIWKIDGKPLYSPSSWDLSITNLQASGERSTADGILHKETIRYGIVDNGSFSYDLMTNEQIRYTRNLVMPRKEFFQLTYLDFGEIKTIECYSNNFGAKLYNAVLLKSGLWQNVTFTCIER